MHASQQQLGHGHLPSSTRSRRASGNHAARPGLHQADYGRQSPVAQLRAGASGSSPAGGTGGVTLQSWARMQYESSTQKQQQQQQQRSPGVGASGSSPGAGNSGSTAQIAAPTPMFQTQYHFAPRSHAPVARPQSSGRDVAHARYASADYIDPYQDTPHGQTLDVDAGTTLPPPGAPRREAPRQSSPSSPVMRAVRHSRPTTPNSAGAVSASASGDFSHSPLPVPAQRSPTTDVHASSGSPVYARMKPRSYTAAEESQRRLHTQASPTTLLPPRPSPQQQQQQQPRSRVDGIYGVNGASSSDASPLSVPTAQLRVEVGHAGTKSQPSPASQQPRTTSELANAAIRGFVDMKASWAQKMTLAQTSKPLMATTELQSRQQQQQQQWSRSRVAPAVNAAPAAVSGAGGLSKISPETSHLIEFIERQRARTMAASSSTGDLASSTSASSTDADRERRFGKGKADAISGSTRSDGSGPPAKRSDSSERSFKRSTARLADVDTGLQKQSPPPAVADRGYRHASWYDPPVRVSAGAPSSTHSSPGAGTVVESRPVLAPSIAGLPVSTRVVPRARAQTTVVDSPAWEATPPVVSSTQPPLVIAHGGVTNRRGERLSRGSHDSLLPPKPRVYSRQTQLDNASVDSSNSRASVNAFARNPQPISVGVQTDEALLQPLVNAQPKATRSCGMQTVSAATIHGDDTVLDLMRQIDSLRQGHANQVSEYQEHVVDLELLNQDLNNEVEQLSQKLEARETLHKNAVDDMRQRLDDANSRVDREIGEMKSMHATKCNELAAQVSMLLGRCEAYKQKLESLGVGEIEMLGIAARSTTSMPSLSERLQIADQVFIETQYVETRESSQEADYFKQLMDIERSMENTTMALGFELKRTQAKYLEQAADFIREQMAKFQSEMRSESRLSMRPESRMSIRRSPPLSEAQIRDALATIPDLSATDPPKAALCKSPVQSLAATLSQLSKTPAIPPLPPSAASAVASRQPQLRPKHQRVVGSEPVGSEPVGDDSAEADELMLPADRPAQSLQGSDQHSPNMPRAPLADARFKQQHAATLSSAFSATAAAAAAARQQHLQTSGSLGRLDARRMESESRVSGLSRMIASAAEQIAAPLSASSGSLVTSGSSTSDSMAGLIQLGNNSPRRSHRSPLAGIAGGFFSSSQESLTTAVAEPGASIVSNSGLSDDPEAAMSNSHPCLVTPTKSRPVVGSGSLSALAGSKLLQPIAAKGASVGYFAGHRKASVADDVGSSAPSSPTQQSASMSMHSSMHWPPRSERKGLSRPHSAANIDSREMTAEELLESLKLPSNGALGITPTRIGNVFGSLPRSPSTLHGGSLGRHSPLPRSGSFTELSRTLPSAPNFPLALECASSASDSSTLPTCTTNSMVSDFGLTPPRKQQSSNGSSPLVSTLSAVFDPTVTVNINLGLDKTTGRSPSSMALGAGSTRRNMRGGNRRRSRSVATWDRR